MLLGDFHYGNRISNYSYYGELTATNCYTVVVLVSVVLTKKQFGICLSCQLISSDPLKFTKGNSLLKKNLCSNIMLLLSDCEACTAVVFKYGPKQLRSERKT